jgi:hypothetical protein
MKVERRLQTLARSVGKEGWLEPDASPSTLSEKYGLCIAY